MLLNTHLYSIHRAYSSYLALDSFGLTLAIALLLWTSTSMQGKSTVAMKGKEAQEVQTKHACWWQLRPPS
eukprot:scaffold295846_cov23-Tisochrysis_lutea.AAC.1